MSLRWADPMPQGGRVAGSATSLRKGRALVCDALMSCPQTLHITLFFDGTNNNNLKSNPFQDSPTTHGRDNPFQDSLHRTHTNVARLYNAALEQPETGIFRFYIPGVGTPFKEIGEQTFTTSGKSMAAGFGSRCVWGYTRVLNAIYQAIATDKTRFLIPDSDAQRVCSEVSDGHKLPLVGYTDRLGLAHKQAVDEGRYPQTVKQIWINVIGFSRGAASARVFVNKLMNEWARNGRIGYQTGKYALNYKVNFVGLFDTVASVGPPDSTRATVDFGTFDGHFAFADDGRLDIPKDVRFCYHAFSVHEQRMSFPLDSIRNGDSYGGGIREEVAYPGVHSDVGGGYAPCEQGKGGATAKAGDDSYKLSQIPLHDMYLKAASYGVPLIDSDTINKRADLAVDFALAPSLIDAFNAWRKTVDNVSSVEDALKVGLSQMLAWRTLRADIGNPQRYVTGQPFFKRAHEDTMTPHKVEQALPKAAENDATMKKLKSQYDLHRANAMTSSIGGYASYMSSTPQVAALNNAMERRNEQLSGAVAHPGVTNPRPARPGEGPLDVTTNDQTDLRQGAEEMRLLLGHLYPDQCERWQVKRTEHPPVVIPGGEQIKVPPTLTVTHDQPGSDSPCVKLAYSGILLNTTWSTLVQHYRVKDDVLAAPLPGVESFLRQHTSPDAVNKLPAGAITLFDDYVHDSRCWFRVPYFHEYAPGGYGFPRVVFAGGDNRKAYLGLASNASQLDLGNGKTQAGWA
ncbi:hypothetical protein WT15_19875 [Burkholderia stagnalis]|uniref:T6SS phospholipase effector Tle1-like catalytic domain-containing protein n=1 Tax=Burkholderia stagnalis TaxID=1503054 RepID=UPI000755CC43|nr:DUF2235 domain-containing protein [Burkholderia stagnalis]KVN76866.1 hypothetical protein WT15_19875 [Burkholderia stagnalis]KWO26502.1 hypothetical protein WT96_32440 [Burkholderia stagnalis]KWO34127.1 hypothetical protein WT95_12355 [Burkholderia stagnalis]